MTDAKNAFPPLWMSTGKPTKNDIFHCDEAFFGTSVYFRDDWWCPVYFAGDFQALKLLMGPGGEFLTVDDGAAARSGMVMYQIPHPLSRGFHPFMLCYRSRFQRITSTLHFLLKITLNRDVNELLVRLKNPNP
jgi:hypothetical protein